jgi:hypothetical protein
MSELYSVYADLERKEELCRFYMRKCEALEQIITELKKENNFLRGGGIK